MNFTRNMLFSLCLCGLPFNVYASGIPVVDATSVAQNAMNFVKDLAEQAKQLAELQNQLQQQIKQYESLTGIRNMGGLIDSIYNNDLGFSQEDIEDFLNHYGLSGFDDESGITSPEAKELAIEEQKKAVAYLEQVKKIQDETITRFNELSRLISEVNAVEDTKAVLDLQARIAGEQAMLNNEAIKVNLLNQQAEAEKRVEDEQKKQALIEILSKEHTVKVNLLRN